MRSVGHSRRPSATAPPEGDIEVRPGVELHIGLVSSNFFRDAIATPEVPGFR